MAGTINCKFCAGFLKLEPVSYSIPGGLHTRYQCAKCHMLIKTENKYFEFKGFTKLSEILKRKNMQQELIQIAGGSKVVVDWSAKGICRACGAEMVWCTTRNQKKMPLSRQPGASGEYESHFASCPRANKFRKHE